MAGVFAVSVGSAPTYFGCLNNWLPSLRIAVALWGTVRRLDGLGLIDVYFYADFSVNYFVLSLATLESRDANLTVLERFDG